MAETNLISWATDFMKNRNKWNDGTYDNLERDDMKFLLTMILGMLDKHNIAEVVLIKVEIRKALEILEGDAK